MIRGVLARWRRSRAIRRGLRWRPPDGQRAVLNVGSDGSVAVTIVVEGHPPSFITVDMLPAGGAAVAPTARLEAAAMAIRMEHARAQGAFGPIIAPFIMPAKGGDGPPAGHEDPSQGGD